MLTWAIIFRWISLVHTSLSNNMYLLSVRISSPKVHIPTFPIDTAWQVRCLSWRRACIWEFCAILFLIRGRLVLWRGSLRQREWFSLSGRSGLL